MAETAVSFVLNQLAAPLLQEAGLLRSVRRDFDSIKDELESIRVFLRDADVMVEKEGIDDGKKTWVKQVREVAYCIEDVVDEYILQEAQHHRGHGCTGILYKLAGSIMKLKLHYNIAHAIKDIKATIKEIKQRGETYGWTASQREGSSGSARSVRRHDSRVISLFIEEDEVVGIESIRNELAGLLIEGEPRRRTTISLVGMGGIGKTTLAKKVYDDQKLSGRFACHAWIAVSRSYREEELLGALIKQVYQSRKEFAPEGIDKMDEESLIGTLREYLQPKRYLIVFDDVWNIEFWGFTKYALPENDKGSRILITTRHRDVALSCKESSFDHVQELLPLPQGKAWELFCKKAFQSYSEGRCPEELETLSADIVRRCEGLPLAIVAIGALLSTKDKNVFEWQKLHDSLGPQLGSNPHLRIIPAILSLSYHDLPSHLKSCLLYCGIFPEDYPISRKRLIRLWIAEGFVKAEKGRTLEEIAEEYLTELIHRSLVQVSEVSLQGKARSCRVHDLMREIILLKSEELSFCQVLIEDDSTLDSKARSKARRLSILNIIDGILEGISNAGIRSVLLFRVGELPKSFMGTCFTNFKLLRVLDFEGAPLDFLPEMVGNLFHLRYLSVRNTKIKMLPKSISKLHNLQTLNLKDSLVHNLPRGIKRLSKLRHLLAYSFDYETDYGLNSLKGVNMREGIGYLKDLQRLCFMEANQGVVLIEELGKLKQLRRLGLTKLTRADCRALCASIQQMNRLESLGLWSFNEAEILDLQHILSPPLSLQRVYLKGPLEKLPDWIPKLQNLVKLRLSWSRLKDDPNLLPVLQGLPKLLELELHAGYDGQQLIFGKVGFQKLKVLRLQMLNGLHSVIIEKGAMPLLEELSIGPSPQLKDLPLGIEHLKHLKTLKLFDMPIELVPRLQPDQGVDYWKVQNIPVVLFTYKEDNRYTTYTLR